MKLPVKSVLFILLLFVSLGFIFIFKWPLAFQTSLTELFPVKINNVVLGINVAKMYAQMLNASVDFSSNKGNDISYMFHAIYVVKK